MNQELSSVEHAELEGTEPFLNMQSKIPFQNSKAKNAFRTDYTDMYKHIFCIKDRYVQTYI